MKRKLFKAKYLVLLAVTILTISVFSTTASAALLGSDTTERYEIYGTAATGSLSVYDDRAYATTTYSRSGSNISISAAVDATFRYGGKDILISDYSNSSAGGTTATVYLSVTDYPNAVFLKVKGSHEVRNYVNGMLLTSGHWYDFTSWTR